MSCVLADSLCVHGREQCLDEIVNCRDVQKLLNLTNFELVETYCSWAFRQFGYCSTAQYLSRYEYHHSSQS